MELDKDIIELVVARLQTLPEDKDISIGSFGEFTKEEIINRVRSGDEVGKKMVEIEMSFLRLMKDGIFYEQPESISDMS